MRTSVDAVTNIPRTRCNVACIAIFKIIEAVYQFKVGRKENANRVLNPKNKIISESNAIVGLPLHYKNHQRAILL